MYLFLAMRVTAHFLDFSDICIVFYAHILCWRISSLFFAFSYSLFLFIYINCPVITGAHAKRTHICPNTTAAAAPVKAPADWEGKAVRGAGSRQVQSKIC